ncbi:MAG: sulfite exporter TauE/SafE family protein [Hyphomicrobiaceae bacterium]
MPPAFLLLVAGGFLVGLLVGLTGVGAGSLTTPFLISVIGVNPMVAVGTDLLFACITKTTSAWHHHRLNNVDYKILGWLALGSLPGAALVFMAFWLTGMDAKALAATIRLVLAIALIISALAIALYPFIAGRFQGGMPGDLVTASPRPEWTFLLGMVIGITVALTSVGAGAIGVVVLTALYPALAMRRLVGTDVVHAIPLTLLAGLGHLSFGHVDLSLLATLLAGSVPGIALGTRLTGILPDRILRALLAGILCLAATALWNK